MKTGICEQCGRQGGVHVHHKDFSHHNNAPANLQTLCPHCHKQVHLPTILIQNQARREDNPYYTTNQGKAGWSEGLTWQELLDARRLRSDVR